MGEMEPSAYEAWYRTPFGSLCHRLERDALFSLTAFTDGERVLDAGCGTGVYLKEFEGLGIRAVGVDSSTAMLGLAARAAAGRAPLAKGLVTALPFKGSSFDKVVSVCVLEFVAHPERAMSEFFRVLKTGGWLLIGFLNKNSPWARLRIEKGKDPSSVWHGARFYGLGDIGRLAGRLDLRLRKFSGAVYFPPDAEGWDITRAEEAEDEGRQSRPSAAAFIAASFVKA